MTYDPKANRVFLFGGAVFGTTIVWKNDTWALSVADNTWTNTHASTSPSPRGGAPLAYDSVSDVALLFGGANTFANTSSGYFNDTWAYNATANAWSNATPVHSPSPRVLSALAYDAIADRAVLFGGAPGSGIPYDDAWAFRYVPPAPSFPPSGPRNLHASGGESHVALVWEAPSSNGSAPVTNYRIYRGTIPGGESLLTTVGNILTYTDSTVANGLTYYYEVSAVSSAAEGPKSNETSATPRGVPSGPLGLTGSAGSAQVTLSWHAPASDGGSAIMSYTVYRGTSTGGETRLTTLGTVLKYVDSGLANGQTYYYEVTATNGVGEGPKSDEASATPVAVPTMPLSLAAAAGQSKITLTWVAPVSDGGSSITGYRVYRASSTGAETLLSTVGAILSYTDSGLTSGQTYYYEVSAVNAVGEGPKSNEASAMPTVPPDATSPTTGVSGLPLPLIAGFGIVVVVVAAATALLVSRRRRR
jgi:fibronectin type 3 domain-containing protein